MKKQWQWIILLSAVFTTCAVSGDVVIRDEAVSGVWSSGSVVNIYGRAWIEAGTELKVEPGVEIVFHSTPHFIVEGMMTMQGSAGMPIILKVNERWEGFKFSDPENSYDWNTIEYVITSFGEGLAETIVNAVDARLRIRNCVFQANNSCINVVNGRLNAAENSFLTYGTFSTCVRITNLEQTDSSIPIDERNRLVDNLIQIDGSTNEDPGLPSWAFGVLINGSTTLSIAGNKIQLYDMPVSSCGMYFGLLPEGETFFPWIVEDCVVKVTSDRSLVSCVQAMHEGLVALSRVTMDSRITDPDTPYLPVAVWAEGSATVQVNTDIVVQSSPSDPVPWQVGPAATINIQYSLRYYEDNSGGLAPEGGGALQANWDGFTNALGQGVGKISGYRDNLNNGIHESETVIHGQPPLFSLVGEEGIWTSHEQVKRYYGLSEASPCRDSGDPDLDKDPDNTRADMGSFYFPSTPDDVPPVLTVPTDFEIQSAYPNPFNPIATIPFALSNTGIVRVAVYDMLGRDAGTLIDGRLNSGQHILQFNGASLASGVYLVSFEYNGAMVGVQRLILLK